MQLAEDNIDILLVDDRPENLLALEAVLKSPDYNLVKVESGDDALRYLLENDPALILMDVQMPDLDGFETASIIKKSERTRDIPIIFMTALNKDERYVHQGYRGGAVDYIPKPFDDEILKAKVLVFVDLNRKTKRLIRAEQALRESDRLERERKLRELELASLLHDQLQQQKYRDLVGDISHAIVWTAEPLTLTFTFVSGSAEQILGYPLAAWVEKNVFVENAGTEQHTEALKTAVQDLVMGRQVEHVLEHSCVAVSGETKWFQTSIRLRRKAKSSSYELRGLSTDITQLKLAQNILQKSKSRSELLSEASYLFAQSIEVEALLKKVGEWIVPNIADWCILDAVNDEGQIELLSVTHPDVSETHILRQTLKKNPWTEDSNAGVPLVIKTGESQLITEQIESYIPNELHGLFKSRCAIVVPLRARGMTLGALTLVSGKEACPYNEDDVIFAETLANRIALTLDNARLFKKATEAVQVRDEFLSVASHELRTPLTALTLQIQLLYRNLKNGTAANYDADRITEMTRGTNRQLKRLCNLLDDLLDVTRISQGKLSLNVESVNLSHLIQEVVSRFEEQLAKSNCKLTLDLPKESVLGEWDPIRIEQVISNLLTNAMKYGAGKPIEINLREKHGRAKISVSDRGIGISHEDQKRIFDRFERAISSQEVSGLGLGLYIVSQILNAHKGHIAVSSEKGKGSTFTVELPLVHDPIAPNKKMHVEVNAEALPAVH